MIRLTIHSWDGSLDPTRNTLKQKSVPPKLCRKVPQALLQVSHFCTFDMKHRHFMVSRLVILPTCRSNVFVVQKSDLSWRLHAFGPNVLGKPWVAVNLRFEWKSLAAACCWKISVCIFFLAASLGDSVKIWLLANKTTKQRNMARKESPPWTSLIDMQSPLWANTGQCAGRPRKVLGKVHDYLRCYQRIVFLPRESLDGTTPIYGLTLALH